METNIDDLKHIRSMMERSTKFLSLSGFSGIWAGVVALVGAGVTKLVLDGDLSFTDNVIYDLAILAVAVIALAGSVGLYLSMRKAKKSKSKFWMPVTKQILLDFSIPMVVGGLLCLLMINAGCLRMVASTMLIFYGLALINASARTYKDIRMLGICEIVLGLLAGYFIYNGLLFWAIGFGLLHIVYGIVMYLKYDKADNRK